MKLFVSLPILALAVVATAQPIPRFTKSTAYSVPGASMAVLADVNGDGKLDIVTANGYAPNASNPSAGGHGVSLLLGNGNGTFQPAQAILSTGNPCCVAVSDFTGDGKADLLVDDGIGTTTVSLLPGNGDGTFQASSQIVVSDSPMAAGGGQHSDGSVVVADFNGDGRPDFAVAYNTISTVAGSAVFTPTAKVFLNSGQGTFVASFANSTPGSLSGTGLYVRDFNGDGIADLLLYGGQRALEIGNGDGTFHQDTTSVYNTITAGTEAVFDDFDGDGLVDATSIVTSPPRTPLTYFVNLSLGATGAFFRTTLNGFFPAGQSTYVAADFDGDGLLDMAGTNAVFYNLGNGLFRPELNSVDFGATNTSVAVGGLFPGQWYVTSDLDGNGSPDLISTEDGRFVEVALNTAGNPPLLASLTPNTATVVTGTSVPETVSIGGPAPSGGAVIHLFSDSASAAVPTSVTIPAGSQSATFFVKAFTGASPVRATIAASYGGRVLQNNLTVVPPFALSSVTANPSSLFGMMGGNVAVGTIHLTGPAADGTVISLSSSNVAIVVPATVTVPPGAATVTFPFSAQFVDADTPVVISAIFQGTTKTTSVTVKKEIVDIAITKAEFTANIRQLKIEGTTTSTAARLDVFDKATGFRLGQVTVSRGRFTGQFTSPEQLPVTTVLVQSTLGEAGSASVTQR